MKRNEKTEQQQRGFCLNSTRPSHEEQPWRAAELQTQRQSGSCFSYRADSPLDQDPHRSCVHPAAPSGVQTMLRGPSPPTARFLWFWPGSADSAGLCLSRAAPAAGVDTSSSGGDTSPPETQPRVKNQQR